MRTRALTFALAAALLACAGSTTSQNPPGGGGSGSGGSSGGGSGGSSSGGSSGGSGSGGSATGCPGALPASGSPCPSAGLFCEYGGDPDLACDTYATCEPNGLWAQNNSNGPPQGCPTNPPGTNGCPATFASVPVSKACSPSGLECGYPQGRCACTTPLSGPAPVNNNPVWFCEQPGSGCPEPRPALGAACATAGQSCDYGACTLPGGTTLKCTNGSWTSTPTPCPL